jgi:multiple sugar transport system permease protein
MGMMLVMGYKIKKYFKRIILYILVIILTFIILFPFYWLIASSLKTTAEIMSGKQSLLPTYITIEHYVTLFTPGALYGGVLKLFQIYILNSLIVASSTTILAILLSIFTGYGFARFNIKGKGTLMTLMLFLYMFPGILLVIPLFKFISQFGLSDTFLGLIVVYTTFCIPFCSWLLHSFFTAIPIEYSEAAMIDGCSKLGAFVRVELPIAGSGILSAAIYCFITAWCEYLFASIIIISDVKKTVPLGLVMYMGQQYIEWGPLLAGGVVVTIPVMLLFFPLSQRFLRGLTAGIKG